MPARSKTTQKIKRLAKLEAGRRTEVKRAREAMRRDPGRKKRYEARIRKHEKRIEKLGRRIRRLREIRSRQRD